MAIISRNKEIKLLNELALSEKPEFLAIYGRRRVGKTFLIREYFSKHKKVIFLNVTGSKKAPMAEQIKNFVKMLSLVFHNGLDLKEPKTWDGVFELLNKAINSEKTKKKIVIFLDEFPWMVTAKSRLLEVLDYYWNQHWSQNSRIKLVICGSAASWIVNKILNNKGGLHNRITRRILLKPFNLHETRVFLEAHQVKLSLFQILQIYLVTGGVPYYLVHVKKGLSIPQIIEALAFTKDSFLLDEFDNVFASLFTDHEVSVQMIRLLANCRYGMSQKELFEKTNNNLKGKRGLSKLKELEDAGFIEGFTPYQRKKKGIYYRVIDEYSLFYLRWIEPIKEVIKKGLPKNYFLKQQDTPAWHSWMGLSFESVCYEHLPQISEALKLSPLALPSTWRFASKKGSSEVGTQIDLLFDREDGAITLCEIKCTQKPFIVDKAFVKELEKKRDIFVQKTKTEKQIFFALISANGIVKSFYTEEYFPAVATLKDLFKS